MKPKLNKKNKSSKIIKKTKKTWSNIKSDLEVFCLLCASDFKIKFNLLRNHYSLKNNWGYWTGKKYFENKYICNECLTGLYEGKIKYWISDAKKKWNFYNYYHQGFFKK